jgi:hypothetical protein
LHTDCSVGSVGLCGRTAQASQLGLLLRSKADRLQVEGVGVEVGCDHFYLRAVAALSVYYYCGCLYHRWEDPGCPQNVRAITTPQEYFNALSTAPGQLVVIDVFIPSCAACRRMFPALKKIASNNPDVLFLKVCVCVRACACQPSTCAAWQLCCTLRSRCGARIRTASGNRVQVRVRGCCANPPEGMLMGVGC